MKYQVFLFLAIVVSALAEDVPAAKTGVDVHAPTKRQVEYVVPEASLLPYKYPRKYYVVADSEPLYEHEDALYYKTVPLPLKHRLPLVDYERDSYPYNAYDTQPLTRRVPIPMHTYILEKSLPAVDALNKKYVVVPHRSLYTPQYDRSAGLLDYDLSTPYHYYNDYPERKYEYTVPYESYVK